MNRAIPIVSLLLWALVLGLAGHSGAAGLKVSPARFVVRNVEPGRQYDVYRETGARLTVYNDGDVARTWLLSLHRPSERGRWETGYAEIPDPQWCWFEEEEITIPPHGTAYAHLHLKVPQGERYYNQHWVATATVGGKPDSRRIALAIDVRILLETKPKTGLTQSPDGPLGVEPSTIHFAGLAPGERQKGRIVLHNNEDVAHEYTVVSLFGGGEGNPQSHLTDSFDALPDPAWVTHESDLRIGPGESAALDVEIRIPDDVGHYGRKWEEVLLIRPAGASPRFVRVLVETQPAPEAGE